MRKVFRQRVATAAVLGASQTWTGPTIDMGQLAPVVLLVIPSAVTGTFSMFLNGRAEIGVSSDPQSQVDIILNRAQTLSTKNSVAASPDVAIWNTSTDAHALPVVTPQVVTAGASSLTFDAWLIWELDV